MAPEVVKQTAHSPKADIWSVGCLVVEMFTGEHPWANLTQMQAIFRIGASAKPEIPADISPEAQDFLALTFDLDYEKRPSATECLQHPWLALSSKKGSKLKPPPPVVMES
jgi:mitogen-activated protein kinase kinase kinase